MTTASGDVPPPSPPHDPSKLNGGSFRIPVFFYGLGGPSGSAVFVLDSEGPPAGSVAYFTATARGYGDWKRAGP